MSTLKAEILRSSMLSARSKQRKTRATRSLREMSSMKSEPVVLTSRSSPSKLGELYNSAGFQVRLDNEIADQVAMHALQLRRYRRMSQRDVARAMETSQPAVARIE